MEFLDNINRDSYAKNPAIFASPQVVVKSFQKLQGSLQTLAV
jgi:hypothetical protein